MRHLLLVFHAWPTAAMPARLDYAASAEWFALTPAAAVVEWIWVPSSHGVVLGGIIVLQTAAAVLFWLSVLTSLLPVVVTYSSAAVLGALWVVNVYRAHQAATLFDGSSAAVLYYNVVRLFSVVSFLTMAPLWGRAQPSVRYGKWVLIAANAVSLTCLVIIFNVAEPYWEAWGCYGGHVPATLKYQKYGTCGDAPIYNVDNIPICHMLGGYDHADPTQVDSTSCNERSADMLAPFRHTTKWACHLLSVTYSAYVIAALRAQTPHALHVAVQRFASSVLSEL